MPVTLDTVENGRVFNIVFSDPWDTADLDAVFAQVRDYLDSVDYKVHTLANLSATRMIPSMPRIRSSMVLTHANNGAFVVVGASKIMRLVVEMIFGYFHFTHFAFFDTEEAAWRYIREAIADEDDGADAAK